MCLTDQWFGYAALTFDRFIAAGGNAGIPDFGQVPPSVTPTSATSHSAVEDAFINYIHEWLLGELEINARMTIEQVEDEFMPLVKEMNFTDFPAEMIYNGMFEQGVPMTFEEFAAQYTPADPTPVPTQTPAPEPTPVPPAPTPGPALVPGDFDGDGVLTALDATLILQYLAGS